jgi:Response regulator containing CheY-like receiver domain and AraC-type DNA-binding domain
MPKVLIADDAAFIRMKLKKVLEDLGLEVIEAANGAEAVQKFNEQNRILSFWTLLCLKWTD